MKDYCIKSKKKGTPGLPGAVYDVRLTFNVLVVE